MRVTVRDRAAEAPWGRGPTQVITRTVTISNLCPVCGHRRLEPVKHVQHEDGVWWQSDIWDNDCGHVDTYEAVLREADQFVVEADEDHTLFEDYVDDWGMVQGDWQSDPPRYGHQFKPFPSFQDWLVQRVVADVENAIADAKYEAVE
jgi:hypothetical protein